MKFRKIVNIDIETRLDKAPDRLVRIVGTLELSRNDYSFTDEEIRTGIEDALREVRRTSNRCAEVQDVNHLAIILERATHEGSFKEHWDVSVIQSPSSVTGADGHGLVIK